MPQALPDDNATYGTEHYGAAVSDALEAHWGEGSDQALLNGYIPAQAAGGTLEERLRGSHLFYSDARTLDELFAAAEDVQWYTDYEPVSYTHLMHKKRPGAKPGRKVPEF